MRKLIASVMVLCLTGLISFSQEENEGYVITNNHDTLWGTFKNDIMSKKIKIIINGELRKFDVVELLSFKKGEEIEKRFTNDLYMAKLEIQGKINFYAIRVKGQYGFDQFFVEKNGESCDVNTKKCKTIIEEWLKDYACDSELLKGEIKLKNIQKIIKEYNRCNATE